MNHASLAGDNAVLVPTEQDEAVQRVMDLWHGTPYAPHRGIRGVAADCRSLVCGVLDKLHGYEPRALPEVPHTVGLHDPSAAAAVVKILIRRFDAYRVDTHEVMSGDVVAVKTNRQAAVTHAAMIPPRVGALFDAWINHGADYSSIGAVTITAIYRCRERDTWN